MNPSKTPLDHRRAGVLLHPTSLPGPGLHGVLGPEAFHFIDWLDRSGLSVWQVLPLGPTHDDGSPYQCLSAHAGDPSLISFHKLKERGWLPADHPAQDGDRDWLRSLRDVYEHWCVNRVGDEQAAFTAFLEAHDYWMPDFALYMALREEFNDQCWVQWPEPLRDRDKAALAEARERLGGEIQWHCFLQYAFFEQWRELKAYANQRDIHLFGDMPIFVAYDSADVWAHREAFLLNEKGAPTVVAGVPPDYFSETGQRWGNPLYDWNYSAEHEFEWWLERCGSQLSLFDVIRVDHFRGFEAYWEIDAQCETAIEGRWVKAPGDALFDRVLEGLGVLPFVAEDLGVITEEVVALRNKYDLPGMKILQFAFDGDATNPYLPHNHEVNSVVYTGTHDNNTTLGWYDALDHELQQFVKTYLGEPGEAIPWPLIRTALNSVARLAVIPMQDFLELGEDHRMNTPGTMEGNWSWRFSWSQVAPDLSSQIRQMVKMAGR